MPRASSANYPINDDPDNDLRRFAADLEGLVMLGRVLSTESLLSEEQKTLNAESERIIREAYAEVERIYKEAGIGRGDPE
jgi:hypothetical protein